MKITSSFGIYKTIYYTDSYLSLFDKKEWQSRNYSSSFEITASLFWTPHFQASILNKLRGRALEEIW